MIDRIFEIHRQYWNLWIPIDAVNRRFITSLKIAMGEDPHYQKAEDVLPGNNKVLPVNFGKERKTMIAHLVALFEDHKVAVPEQFDKSAVALRSAIVNEYSLDKELSAYNDLTDAMRLSLRCFKIE
jgi:hypothetical protein